MKQTKTTRDCGCVTVSDKVGETFFRSMTSLCYMHSEEQKEASRLAMVAELAKRARSLDILTCDGCGQYLCEAVMFDLNGSYFYHKGCAEKLKAEHGNTQL